MGILNRILRLMGLLLIILMTSIVALRAYGNSLEIIPPISMSFWNDGVTNNYLVDLNRGTQLHSRFVSGENLRSPNGVYWANGVRTGNGLEISVARYPNAPQVLGIYDVVGSFSPYMTWSADSDALYIVERNEDADGLLVMAVDIETGNTSLLVEIETYDVPQYIFRFSDNHLVLGANNAIIVNIANGSYHILDVAAQDVFQYNSRNGFVFYGHRNNTQGYLELESLNVLRLDDFSVETIDLDVFPSPPIPNTMNALAWSPDGWHVGIVLASGGIGVIDIQDLSVEILDVTMGLQGGWSADNEWLLGIQDSPDRANSAMIAYHIETGEIKTIISGKQPDVVIYRARWSPVGNTILLYNLQDYNMAISHSETINIPISVYDLETEQFIYETTYTPPQGGQAFMDWSYEWFNLRYDLDECSDEDHECIE